MAVSERQLVVKRRNWKREKSESERRGIAKGSEEVRVWEYKEGFKEGL